jgi:ketosteroid isomerase-like protein
MAAREPAREPEDLARMFVERVNDGDLDGIVELYEPDAVLAFPTGRISVGSDEIREVYRELLAAAPKLSAGVQRPALRNGDLALTSTELEAGAGVPAEVARRRPDGTWRWLLDRPNLLA